MEDSANQSLPQKQPLPTDDDHTKVASTSDTPNKPGIKQRFRDYFDGKSKNLLTLMIIVMIAGMAATVYLTYQVTNLVQQAQEIEQVSLAEFEQLFGIRLVPQNGNWDQPDTFVISNVSDQPVTFEYVNKFWADPSVGDFTETTLQPGESFTHGGCEPDSVTQVDLKKDGKGTGAIAQICEPEPTFCPAMLLPETRVWDGEADVVTNLSDEPIEYRYQVTLPIDDNKQIDEGSGILQPDESLTINYPPADEWGRSDVFGTREVHVTLYLPDDCDHGWDRWFQTPPETATPEPTTEATPTTSPTTQPTTQPTQTPTPTPTVTPTATPNLQACNAECSSDSYCQDFDSNYVCHNGNCRRSDNRSDDSCAVPISYSCNSDCQTNSQCQSIGQDYACIQGNCRLISKPADETCQPAVGGNIAAQATATPTPAMLAQATNPTPLPSATPALAAEVDLPEAGISGPTLAMATVGAFILIAGSIFFFTL